MRVHVASERQCEIVSDFCVVKVSVCFLSRHTVSHTMRRMFVLVWVESWVCEMIRVSYAGADD